MNRKSTSVWTLSSVVTILCLMAGCLHGVGFTWTGVIVMTPESGLVACGNNLGARVVDAFDVARPLPDNEYVINEGTPTYDWYVNGTLDPYKHEKSVVFSTGDWDECGEYDDRPDIDAGDFTLSVKGSRAYVVGWKDGNDCPCGCGMDDCECGGNGFRGCGGCGGKETKRGSSRQDAAVRGRHEQNYPINNYLLASADGIAVKILLKDDNFDYDITNALSTCKVGSRISLSVQVKRSRKKEKKYLWNIPGSIFKNYNEVASSNPLSEITEDDKKNPNIAFYWIDRAINRRVSCTVLIEGQQFTGNTFFNVLRPNVNVSATINSSYNIIIENGKRKLCFGNINGLPGITFTRSTLSDPQYANDEFCWTQVINTGIANEIPSGHTINLEKMLDDEFSYSSEISVGDRPFHEILDIYTQVTQQLRATMYLMYRPSGPSVNSPCWVPLKKVVWRCQGAAVKINGAWTVQNPTQHYDSPVEEIHHPDWDGIKRSPKHEL